jgi:hypothetical protein
MRTLALGARRQRGGQVGDHGLASAGAAPLAATARQKRGRHLRSHGPARPATISTLTVLLGAAALAAPGCAAKAEWAGTIEERDGVVYVTNLAEPLWASPVGSADGAESQPLGFELEQVYGVESEPAEAILGSVRMWTVDDDQNVYVLDPSVHRIIAFAADGSVRWAAGRAGEGPGDLAGYLGLATYGHSTLFVLNQAGTRVDRWSLAGDYLGGNSLDAFGFARLEGLTFAPPNHLITRRRRSVRDTDLNEIASEYSVLVMDDPWRLDPEIIIRAEPPVSTPVPSPLGIDTRFLADRILAGNSGGYVLRAFDRDGTLVRQVTRPFDGLLPPGFHITQRPGGATGVAIYLYGDLSAPLPLPSGHWLAYVWWEPGIDDPEAEATRRTEANERFDESAYHHAIDLFDPEGRFLYSWTGEGGRFPEIGNPERIGADGRLYTTLNDPYPQVRRYRVEIEER